ncbi:MAG TPA: FISUMP domain-containing protein [Bacteroidales bacterium]|nr:FISUMP domain-containing protein [Bacteroidales bacterium]HRX97281.1 FISUMP domain-containing protein [Bacteroidales bacterium]
MKRKIHIHLVLLFVILLTGSCKKDEILFNEATGKETFTDTRDGKTYRIVTIGNQTWMAQNLDYNSDNGSGTETYARFYDYDEIFEAVPPGWHLPSEAEVQELIDYLGGESVAGGKLKETGADHWRSPNTGATNSSGFTALPAGIYDYNSGCALREEKAYFWIPDTLKVYNSKCLALNFDNEEAIIKEHNISGDNALSIRCIRD